LSSFASLFDLPLETRETVMRIVRDGFDLRDFQREDVDAILDAIFTRNCRAVLAVAATGLGKSVMLAELARILSSRGYRVLTTVDVGTLARDLSRSITHHTGKPCGILTGEAKEHLDATIIASTIQTLYAKCRHTGRKRIEWGFDVAQKWALLVDECESAIAKEFMAVCRHLLDGNPDNILIGTTATPMRGDKRGLGELFDHASNEPGPLNRCILWGCDAGWLVRPRQAFIRVNLDFSTLKVKRNANGERDYSDEDLGKLLSDEQVLREYAVGIHKLAQGDPSMIVVPTIDVAEKLSHHLCAVAGEGLAHAVSSKNKSESHRLIERFKRSEYPYIVSVAMLYKGFDADEIRNVFMGRKTQSQRIYAQAMGRGTRPLKCVREALAAAPDAATRRAIIEASSKPCMTMVDLVGNNPNVKDIAVLDVLGEACPLEVREHAKQKMLDEADEDAEPIDVEKAARTSEAELAEEERRRMERDRKKRELIQVDGQVDIEFTGDLRQSAGKTKSGEISDRLIASLTGLGVKSKDMQGWDRAKMVHVNGELIGRRNKGLASWAQRKLLHQQLGYTRDQLIPMTRGEASALLEPVFAKWNGAKVAK
jgi:superfamily II DNA or RNA helicase